MVVKPRDHRRVVVQNHFTEPKKMRSVMFECFSYGNAFIVALATLFWLTNAFFFQQNAELAVREMLTEIAQKTKV